MGCSITEKIDKDLYLTDIIKMRVETLNIEELRPETAEEFRIELSEIINLVFKLQSKGNILMKKGTGEKYKVFFCENIGEKWEL